MNRVYAGIVFSAFVTSAFADNGVYLAPDFGEVNYSNATVTGASNYTYRNPSTARIGGGYHFSRHASIEASYASFEDSNVTFLNATTKLEASVIQVAAIGTYPFSNFFSLFGKLGLARVSFEESGTGAAWRLNGSGSSTNLSFGFGGQFNIKNRFSIRAQYEDFGNVQYSPTLNDFPQREANIGVTHISVGTLYNF